MKLAEAKEEKNNRTGLISAGRQLVKYKRLQGPGFMLMNI